jgi:hypothetical protein
MYGVAQDRSYRLKMIRLKVRYALEIAQVQCSAPSIQPANYDAPFRTPSHTVKLSNSLLNINCFQSTWPLARSSPKKRRCGISLRQGA